MNYLDKLKITLPLRRNRYVITSIIFLIWLGFFDQNSFVDRISLSNRNAELKKLKEHYIREVEEKQEKMEELKSDSEKLEKFAREEYLMKKQDEDIFIIVED